MPVLDVEKFESVLYVIRSLSPGYAGINNDLFYRENTLMLFDDEKKMTEDITKNLQFFSRTDITSYSKRKIKFSKFFFNTK